MRLAVVLSALAATDLLLGFVGQWFVLVSLGPGFQTDALYAGLAVPQVVVAVVSGSMTHVLVPLLAAESTEDARRTAWTFILLIGAVFSATALLLGASAPLWLPRLLPGFPPQQLALAVRLTRVQLAGSIFIGLNGVLWAVYHARQRFIWADLSPALAALAALGGLIWALPRYGVIAVAWLSVGRAALQTLLLSPILGPYAAPQWRGQATREAWRRLRPLLAGSAYYKTDVLIDRFLLSMAPQGSLSLLALGQQFLESAVHIVNKALAAPLVPQVAMAAKRGEMGEVRRLYRQRVSWLAVLTAAGYVTYILVGRRMLQLLVGHGAVTQANVTTLWTLIALAGGLWVVGPIGQVQSATMYALGNTRAPTVAGAIAYTAGMGLKIGFFLAAGTMGLAAGISAYYLVALAIMTTTTRRVLGATR